MIKVTTENDRVDATIEGNIFDIMTDGIATICSLISHISELDPAAGMVVKMCVIREIKTGALSKMTTDIENTRIKIDMSTLGNIIDKLKGEQSDAD